jgi:putative chitinase
MTLRKGMIGASVGTWQTFLNSQGFDCGTADSNFGNKTVFATIAFQKANGLDDDGIVGSKTIAVAEGLGYNSEAHEGTKNGDITVEQLSYIMKGGKRADVELYLPSLNSQMKAYQINTPLRKQHFLSQLGHESGSLKYRHEIADGSAYENRTDLGNIHTGDGKKYRGEGLIQLTGRNNITAYAGYCEDLDLIEHPERIGNEPKHAVGAACWFWKTRNLNKWADRDDVVMVTKVINGGTNGLEDRKQYLKRAKEVIRTANDGNIDGA